MTKEVDTNGFWRIKDNPLSKEGVYPYLGRQISPELIPDKIYWVYRPIEELSNPETIESFEAVPLIDEHEMIGEGFTKYDDRPAGGIIYNVHSDDGKLLGDIRIFSENLKDEIESGKKELSMGYRCNYVPQKGVWQGKLYDYVQTNLRGNHVALVDRGRMGSDVRVYDQQITYDTIDGVYEMTEVKDEKVDKRKDISEIEAMLYEAKKDPEKLTDELIKTIVQKVENNSYNESEGGANDEDAEEKKDDKKAEDEDVKESKEEKEKDSADEDANEKDIEENGKTEDNDECKKEGMDAMPILKMIAERDSLVKKVEPMIGTFDSALMTADQVAKYAVEKLGIACDSGEELAVLKGYLQGHKAGTVIYSLDSAPTVKGQDKAISKYLKGE